MVGIDEHLREVLARHRVDTGLFSPVRGVQPLIEPLIQTWGGPFIVDIRTSGSFAKGTAVHGGTDIDLFVSLTSTLTDTQQRISDTLFNAFLQAGYAPRRQNVSTGLTVNGWKVDVTPARRQDQYGNYHSLWSTKTGSWLQTNISEHIRVVSNSGRLDEIRLIKIWRNHFGIDWQSFYLELFVLDGIGGDRLGMPIVTEAANSLDATQIVRATVQETWDFIISDLVAASELLEGKTWADLSNKHKADEWAAKGFLAKVYVFAQDWDAATRLLDEVISNSGKSLVPFDMYKTMFNGKHEFNAESLYELSLHVDMTYAVQNELSMGSHMGTMIPPTYVSPMTVTAIASPSFNVFTHSQN